MDEMLMGNGSAASERELLYMHEELRKSSQHFMLNSSQVSESPLQSQSIVTADDLIDDTSDRYSDSHLQTTKTLPGQDHHAMMQTELLLKSGNLS